MELPTLDSLLHALLGLVLAPFLLSVINRTKALIAGRTGQPWLQPYFDLWKLLRKGAVYSTTTNWIFRAGPLVTLAAVLTAWLLVPFAGSRAVLAFPGDLLLFVYLLGLARVATVLAALDTGSSFEGMGASREVWVSALAEPALLLGLTAVARELTSTAGLTAVSLTALHERMDPAQWGRAGVILSLVALSLMVVLLAENSRIPVDDPTTHLELTMIHEVMVLDHGGPDLAFILYGAALKFWVLASVLVGIVLPIRTGFLDTLLALAAVLVLAVIVGLVESSMARLRMVRVPQLLVGASALAALAFVLERQGGILP
jgi:formate hydrogenlyase subunit 4